MSVTPDQMSLAGRVAVVTGGGAGIGRGIAAGLRAFGADVAIWERDPDSCSAAAESIGALGIVTDVRDGAAVDAALARTTTELGTPTVLVNNAGGVFKSGLLETTENGWDALYRSNLRHVLLCTQRVARAMVAAGLPGSVINLTSIEGVRAAPGYAAYAAAKAGVINYTQTAALELAPHGIRVNALAPDITLTEGLAALTDIDQTARMAQIVPMGRPGHVDDIAGAAVFLASDAGRLHHRSDLACGRRHPGIVGLVSPPEHRRLHLRAAELMDLLLISDTHVPKRARDLPAVVWDEVARADVVIHAGDWVDVALLDELERRAARLVACWGNNDGADLRARLPERADVTLGGVRFTVVHETGGSAGRDARMSRLYPDTDVLVFGHSHIPWDTTSADRAAAAEPGFADRPAPSAARHLHDRRGVRRRTRPGHVAPDPDGLTPPRILPAMKSDLLSRRDLDFLLYEWLDVDDADQARTVRRPLRARPSTTCSTCASSWPPGTSRRHNKKSDANEPTFDGTTVTVIPEVKEALGRVRRGRPARHGDGRRARRGAAAGDRGAGRLRVDLGGQHRHVGLR